jgi:segregation and condensation protein B
MIESVGTKDAVGRPVLFGTTEDFLKKFGLRDLAELPLYSDVLRRVEEIETSYNAVTESLYRDTTNAAEQLDMIEDEIQLLKEVAEYMNEESAKKVEPAAKTEEPAVKQKEEKKTKSESRKNINTKDKQTEAKAIDVHIDNSIREQIAEKVAADVDLSDALQELFNKSEKPEFLDGEEFQVFE